MRDEGNEGARIIQRNPRRGAWVIPVIRDQKAGVMAVIRDQRGTDNRYSLGNPVLVIR